MDGWDTLHSSVEERFDLLSMLHYVVVVRRFIKSVLGPGSGRFFV